MITAPFSPFFTIMEIVPGPVAKLLRGTAGQTSATEVTNALLDEVIDFFLETKRQVFRKILSASRRFETAMKAKMSILLTDEKFEEKIISELERLTDLSASVPESAE